MKLSILLSIAHVGSTLGQNQDLPQLSRTSNVRQRETMNDMKEECDAGIGNHLVKIGNHAWNESKFSDEDYEEAKTLLEVVKEKLMENADSIEDGEKAVANMDKKAILTELFPNINQDSSEQDTPKRMLTTQNSNEIEDFMTELEVHLNKFPYDEALKKK